MAIQLGTARLTRVDMLRNSHEFMHVRNCATRYVGKLIIVNIAPALDNRVKVGVIASRKFNRRAVIRNRAKRLMKESFRLVKGGIDAPVWVVIIARRYITRAQLESVQQELIGFLIKSKVFTYYRFTR